VEGPVSENGDPVGCGMELPMAAPPGPNDRVILRNSIIYNNKPHVPRLLKLGMQVEVFARDNTYTGVVLQPNDRPLSRKALGALPNPALAYQGPPREFDGPLREQ